MRIRSIGVALVVAVVATIGVVGSPSTAHAKFVFTTKFMCPDNPGGDLGTFGHGGGFIGNIYYETVTTVHNPTRIETPFNKYFALALRQHQLSSFDSLYGANAVTFQVGHILDAGDAIAIDCDSVVFHLLQSGIPAFLTGVSGRIDGMTVIESHNRELSVQTLYGVVVTNLTSPQTARSGVTVDVENITPIKIKGGFKLADNQPPS